MINKKSQAGMTLGFRTVIVWAVLIATVVAVLIIMGTTTNAGNQILAEIKDFLPII